MAKRTGNQIKLTSPLTGKYIPFDDYKKYLKIYENDSGNEANAFAQVKGRMFDYWIDDIAGSARSNGYSQNELIENPAYIIESILRDEVFTERGLKVDDFDDGGATIVIDGTTSNRALISDVKDFYNYAIYKCPNTGNSAVIADYDGDTKTLTIDPADGDVDDGMNVVISNIQGHNKIDHTSFDKVGNTTNGLRNGWKFAKSIGERRSSNEILLELCTDSFCILVTSQGKYKLIALDAEAGSVDTWSAPLIQGAPLVGVGLTTIENVYSSFVINYGYNYASQKFEGRLFVNPSGGYSGVDSGEITACYNAMKNHKSNKELTINSFWIYDETTAKALMTKVVNWFTFQHTVVSWAGDFKNYVKYEIGDQVKINFSSMIPASKNNGTKFMIFQKDMDLTNNFPVINFSLIEMV